ncbi:hypothetical protein [Sporosarcina sp. OR05]|uniref:hypothetical protein n=1 Tax=Sporosarcina sp. OR05 TaxID=2969819 RepID=UPI00352AD684
MIYWASVEINDGWKYSDIIDADSKEEAKNLFSISSAFDILESLRGEELLNEFNKKYLVDFNLDKFFKDKIDLKDLFKKWSYGKNIAIDCPKTIELIDYILKKEYEIECYEPLVISKEKTLHTYETFAKRISELQEEKQRRKTKKKKSRKTSIYRQQ